MLIIYPSCLVIERISVQVGLMKMFLGLLQLRGREMAGRQREKERTERRESGGVEKEGTWGCSNGHSTSCFSHVPLLVGSWPFLW